jgi:CRISPR system Cascade subunit CasA
LWNLLDERWVRVRPVAPAAADARSRLVGLRELLLDAHAFAAVEVDFTTQRPALFRQLLLPLVADALGFPEDDEEWAGWFSAGRFTETQRDLLTAYFAEHRHRFDLFSPDDPFAQVAGLRTAKDATKSTSLLVATAAQGNNVPLFSPRTDADTLDLTPAEAAHWLLHLHCWDTGAIKTGAVGDGNARAGKTTGNPVGPLGQLGVVMPLGRTVFDTLLLNIPYGPELAREHQEPAGGTGARFRDPDLPQWRRRDVRGEVRETRSCATPAWEKRTAAGPLDLWTWQARRIRLVPEPAEDGGTVVRRCVVTAGDRIAGTQEAHETHTAWRVESGDALAKRRREQKDDTLSPYRPVRHRSGRSGWRGLNSLLAVVRSHTDAAATHSKPGFHTSLLLTCIGGVRNEDLLPADYPLQIELTGVTYGDKLGFVEDTFHDEIPLPITALRHGGLVRGGLLRAVEQAEHLARAVDGLALNLRRAAGQRPPTAGGRGPRPDTATQAGAELLHALDPHVRSLLRDLRTAGEDRARTATLLAGWELRARRETWKVADALLSAASPTVFAGREIVLNDVPRTYRLSNADQIFRAELNKILRPPSQAGPGGGGGPDAPPGPPSGIPSPTPPPIGTTSAQELPG